MDLGKPKFAELDKETGKYKEIDHVNILTKPVTKTEISADVTLNKETEKLLFGNSEEALSAPLSALQQELKEESDAIRTIATSRLAITHYQRAVREKSVRRRKMSAVGSG